MNLQGFCKINEPEIPKSILKKKSQYDQKSKCLTDSIPKPVKTIRFTTEIQKKSKFFSSLHSTLLSNNSSKEKKVKNEKKGNKNDNQKNIKGKIEGRVRNLPKRVELITEEAIDSQKQNDYNLSRLSKSDEKATASRQKPEVAVDKHVHEKETENVFIGEEKKLELEEIGKMIMKKNIVEASLKDNGEKYYEKTKLVRENVDEISPEEKIVEKKRRRRRKRKK